MEIREFAAGVTMLASSLMLGGITSGCNEANQAEAELAVPRYHETQEADEPFMTMPLFVGGIAAGTTVLITFCELYRRSQYRS